MRRPECTPSAQRPASVGQPTTLGYTGSVPTYEYECTACGRHIEVFQRFTEDALTECGACGGALRKVFHPAGIVFKGAGFYATDSRSSKPKADAGAAKSSDSGGSKDAKPSTSDGAAKAKDGGSKSGASKEPSGS